VAEEDSTSAGEEFYPAEVAEDEQAQAEQSPSGAEGAASAAGVERRVSARPTRAPTVGAERPQAAPRDARQAA
jgi:hypothetical protein